ncbi:MAG: outer membrane lipoprotein carrier protein LolA [Clostridia bacterium]|nr:outer membrane lipoprotein carrier protein LolA [Clostridia bacterium]
MKKIILPVILMMVLSACAGVHPELDTSRKIYNTFAGMQSYSAIVRLTAYSNNNTNTYEMKQYYKSPDKMRSESGGVITVINGDSAMVKGSGTSSPFKLERLNVDEGDFMFLQNFFEAYYQGELTTASVSSDDDRLVTLTVDTGLANQYKTQAKLVIDSEKMMPVSLEIKGSDGKTYSKLEYTEFKINPELGDELFRIS